LSRAPWSEIHAHAILPPKDAAPRSRAAALKALTIDDADDEAHIILAIENQWYEWD
jgi:hypothetical protein